jgi:hypothetical protein
VRIAVDFMVQLLYDCVMLHRQLSPGFESKVPVLFLDLNDDLLTPCDEDPEGACATGKLHGEKPETMIDLPIITREGHAVREWSPSALC